MVSSSPSLGQRLKLSQAALRLSESKLKLSYKKLEKYAHEKTSGRIKTDKTLHTEVMKRKKVELRALEIAQKEQRRFGSQLHDGLCQELTAILVFAKSLTQKMEKENILELAELKKISDMLLDAVDEARDTARGLYPGEMEGASLMHSLEELLSRTQSLSGVSCRFFCPEPIFIDDNNIATHLYRITQEGISNAIQHGKAKSIEVSFIRKSGTIILTIKDDGIGCPKNIPTSKGIGLHIMQYRAHMMDASFHKESNKPHGVILTFILKDPPCAP